MSGARCRQRIRLGCFENQIGRPELPALSELRRRRGCGSAAFGRAGGGPVGDQLDLIVGQAQFIFESALSWFGKPGRHEAAARDVGDLATRAYFTSSIGEQRERTGFPRTMARRAVLITIGAMSCVKEGAAGAARCKREDQKAGGSQRGCPTSIALSFDVSERAPYRARLRLLRPPVRRPPPPRSRPPDRECAPSAGPARLDPQIVDTAVIHQRPALVEYGGLGRGRRHAPASPAHAADRAAAAHEIRNPAMCVRICCVRFRRIRDRPARTRHRAGRNCCARRAVPARSDW